MTVAGAPLERVVVKTTCEVIKLCEDVTELELEIELELEDFRVDEDATALLDTVAEEVR